mmetsp:Transcript_12725/g.46977  ORF Transcript_12725/g.46977 Transcript_12725/m.46977 type:complete len:257 (+) Transcript_12725:370-1140(+)
MARDKACSSSSCSLSFSLASPSASSCRADPSSWLLLRSSGFANESSGECRGAASSDRFGFSVLLFEVAVIEALPSALPDQSCCTGVLASTSYGCSRRRHLLSASDKPRLVDTCISSRVPESTCSDSSFTERGRSSGLFSSVARRSRRSRPLCASILVLLPWSLGSVSPTSSAISASRVARKAKSPKLSCTRSSKQPRFTPASPTQVSLLPAAAALPVPSALSLCCLGLDVFLGTRPADSDLIRFGEPDGNSWERGA